MLLPDCAAILPMSIGAWLSKTRKIEFGAAEDGGRRRLRERKCDAQRFAVAADLGDDRRRSIGRRRRCHVLCLMRRDGGGRAQFLRQGRRLGWRCCWLFRWRWCGFGGFCRRGGLDQLCKRRRFGRRSHFLRDKRHKRRSLLCHASRGRGQLLGRIRFAFGMGADRLNIHDVVVVLAERADVDLANEFELHRGSIAARLRSRRRRSSAAAPPVHRQDRSAAAPRTSSSSCRRCARPRPRSAPAGRTCSA